MNNTRLLVVFTGGVAFAGTLSLLQGQTPSASVAQQLLPQYRIASVDGSGRLVRAGSVLVVAQDGLKANPPSAYGCWYNSHKPGGGIKYSVVSEALTPADLRNQMRFLQVGEKVVVVRLDVKPSEVDFCVQTYTDNPNDIPYRAGVLFQFQQKNFVQPANLKAIQDSIAEVFSPDTASLTEGSVPASGTARGPQTPSEPQVVATQLESIAGTYVMTKAPDNWLALNADGTLVLRQKGRTYPGDFKIEGSKLTLWIGTSRTRSTSVLQGDTMTDPEGSAWVKQKSALGAAPSVAPPPPVVPVAPPVAPLKLPCTYVSAQAPADQLQLNADNTFSLQEAGQSYGGTFAANGSALKLNISGGPETTATIQGNNLTDGSGQTWVLREQPSQAASGAAVLQNQDIIKMVKAGLDEAIIIAKISGSKCQFDTSTDALIQLKESGVSPAVLKAMVGAGR
jgi:hypothetical protein